MQSIPLLLNYLGSLLLYPYLAASIALPAEHHQRNVVTSSLLPSSSKTDITIIPRRNAQIRRASTSLVFSHNVAIGDGWLCHYDPLQPFVSNPQDVSSRRLEQFYLNIIDDIRDLLKIQPDHIPDREINFAANQHGSIGLQISSEVDFDWKPVTSFLTWIVSKRSPLVVDTFYVSLPILRYYLAREDKARLEGPL